MVSVLMENYPDLLCGVSDGFSPLIRFPNNPANSPLYKASSTKKTATRKSVLGKLPIAMRMLARDKGRPVEPGRVIKVMAERDAVEANGSPQELNRHGGLVLDVIFRRLLVGAGVIGGAVEAEGYKIKYNDGIFYLHKFKNNVITICSTEKILLLRQSFLYPDRAIIKQRNNFYNVLAVSSY